MLKRSLVVLVMLGAGIGIGVVMTGVLHAPGTPEPAVPAVSAAPAPPAKAPAPQDPAPARLDPAAKPEPARADPKPQPPPEPARPAPQAAPSNGALKIGVVNLKKIFEEEKPDVVKEEDAKLEKFYETLKTEGDALQKRLRGAREELEGIQDRTTQLYQDKLSQFKMTEFEVELRTKMSRARYLDKYSQAKTEVFNQIVGVIKTVALENGFDLVLRIEEPQLEDDSPVSVTQRINNRVVLFAGEKLDLTKKVIERLNQEHAKKKAAAGNPDVATKECAKCKKATPATETKCKHCGEPFPK